LQSVLSNSKQSLSYTIWKFNEKGCWKYLFGEMFSFLTEDRDTAILRSQLV